MAQQTNLNVSPYFDDFDANNNYHKVLFKPGYPVQARELTGLQSILQNQIDKFGQHFFKEGAKVIPGNTAYTKNYHCLEINNTHLGFPVDYYIEQLVDRKIVGLNSGVTAIISKIVKSDESERGHLTLYISYISTGVIEGNEVKEFQDGELLTADTDIISGPLNNPFIPSGESFASAITTDAASKGSAFSISNGVYFVRGTFVNVHDETIVLSQYDNNTSCRVGLKVTEKVVNSDEDQTLTDNSKGFNNYAAPGADRLQISCNLHSKPIDDLNDANFVELAVVENGTLKSQVKNTQYSVIGDEIARRTYDESGDYTINPFSISIKESLNNNLGNNGVYKQGQFSYQGTLVSEDLAQYAISPGKAYVKGYEVETISTTYLDCPKTRTTKTNESEAIQYNTGRQFKVNGAYGVPEIGIGNTYIVSLRNQRIDSTRRTADGTEIGVARVYDVSLDSGTYDISNLDKNSWDLSLYDIQTFAHVTLNEPTTLTIPTFIKGKYSGATAFLQSAVSNSTSLVIYERKGDFITNEPFNFNGIEDSRVAIAITNYGLQDVKSIYGGPDLGNVGFARTFNADTIQEQAFIIGDAKVGARNQTTGISVVTSSNPDFPGATIKENDLVSFSGPVVDSSVGAGATVTIARVVGVTTNYVSITGVTTVSGVVEGNIPQVGVATLSVPDLALLVTPTGGETENTLYTQMPRDLIENVDLTDAQLDIRKRYDVVINASTGALTETVLAGENETFLPFDEDRYILIRADGKFEPLTDDRFQFGSGNTTLIIDNIGDDLSNNEDATLIATLQKIKPTAKVKRKQTINTISVDKSKLVGSGIGATTLNDGLTYGNYPYGTRVQDPVISLNCGDVIEILGVYESVDTSEPSADKSTFASFTGPAAKITDCIIGERFIGESSEAIGVYAEKITDTQCSFITLSGQFTEGEKVVFQESEVQAILTTLDKVSENISSSFKFDTGQRGSFYDYGTIKRKPEATQPTKQLKVYFSNGYYDSSDKGDITTKNSYNNLHYVDDVKTVNGIRNTDMIDIRPKVSNYTVAENARSPLEFYGRTFNADGNTAANILAADSSIIATYSFYVGRIDRIFLTKEGKFQVQYGDPSEKMVEPVIIDDAIEIGTVELLPYMIDVESSTSIQFLNHKRYRMSDIKKLEERIKNLEYYTSLSVLETNTSNMFVADKNGLNRFKSGFFVDNFTTFLAQETGAGIKNSLDIQNKELRPLHYTNSIDLELGPVEGVSATEDRSFLTPEGTNIRRSGDIVTLDYTEVEWLKQSFATRSESITPFLVSFWQMSMDLTPSSDTWVDTTRIEAKVIQTEGNYAQTMAENPDVDPQTGMAPIMWNSWETVWTGQEVNTFTRTRNETSSVRSKSRKLMMSENNFRRFIRPNSSQRWQADRSTARKRHWHRHNRGRFLRSIRGRQWSDLMPWQRRIAQNYFTKGFPGRFSQNNFFSNWQAVAKSSGVTNRQGRGGRSRQRIYLETTTNRTVEDTMRDVIDTGTKTRTGSRTVITEQFDTTSQGDKVVNREVIPIMRSRNIQFHATKCKPLTRMYAFFDGVNVDKYCTPKLLQIKMKSGTFQVGERVRGSKTSSPANIRFRVCQANHREGPYNAPTAVFKDNPYITQSSGAAVETAITTFMGTPGVTQLQSTATSSATSMPATYSSTTSVLNVDTLSLSQQAQGDYFGWVAPGMTLIGQTSGAVAEVTEIKLISDLSANLLGSFYIPDANQPNNPRFETGSKVFTLIDNETNDQNDTETLGEETYTASGTLETVQETIISVRNAKIETKQETESEAVRRSTGPQVVSSKVIATSTNTRAIREWYDPLAQSYQVLDETGVFLTSCDVFFQTKDDMDIPMTFQLRTMKGGVPTQKILPFSEVIIQPEDINVSANGTVPTNVKFKAPVYMEAGQDYAITLASWSTKYKVFISRIGESDLITDEFISQQPYLGSLFKSQNASTWDASQWEDLKFTLYRAEFETEGTLELYNPILSEGNKQIPTLMPNSINLKSRKVRVGLGTTLGRNMDFEFGNTVYQEDKNSVKTATGNYVGNAGVATGAMTVISAGFGYTPASGVSTVVGVALSTITGNGKNATAVVTYLNGAVTGASVSTSGYGYQIGDVVGIVTSNGLDAELSIVSIASTNELILDNVQGNFQTGVGNTLMYTSSVGIATTMNGGGIGTDADVGPHGGNVLPINVEIIDDIETGYQDGIHIVVDHKNHGMYHEINYVTISDVEGDVLPTKLSSPYSEDSTLAISVDSSTNFTSFEGVGVAASNPGYVKIGNEIIKYTGVSGNTLTGIDRSTWSTTRSSHLKGELVYKQELGGVSLARINKTHNLLDRDDAIIDAQKQAPIGYDHYTIKVDFGAQAAPNTAIGRSTSESFPLLYVNDTKSTGGFNIKATQNMPFEIISPQVHNITVAGTKVSAEMRTVSGTSLADGAGFSADIPFTNSGYETITLNKANYMNTTRCIASRINETSSPVIQDFSGDRSFNLRLNLESNDPRVSPIIDTQRANVILTSNRCDAPILDYIDDPRVADPFIDPTGCQYISKENVLANGASSIQVILDAHVSAYNDIRCFYAISDTANFEPKFIPFPGYTNLDAEGDILFDDKSDGRPNAMVPFSNPGFISNEIDFKEHQWSMDNLPKFMAYRIKIILASTNQVYVPRIKDLRVITLA